jgi:MFS family permease
LLASAAVAETRILDAHVTEYAGYTTMVFMIGWAVGGVIFGVLGDRLGRARTMILTILVYSLCTGLSAFAVSVWDFAAYRFMTGLGGGGQFAVGVALVAEVMPARARPHALGWLQASALLGNMMAAGLGIALGQLKSAGLLASAWRPMFFVGMLPALLVLVILRRLREPERWSAAAKKTDREKLGSLR